MKLVALPPEKGRPDWEVVWLLVLGAVFTGGWAWLAFQVPTPRCLFHAATGLPCLTCGGTRCVHHALAGEWGAAFAWNPLVFVTLAGAGILLVYAGAAVLLRLPRLRIIGITRSEAWALRIAAGVFLVANWIYLVARGV